MIALDTSVVVASFASWHEAHEAARAALDDEARLPAHVVLESYSVLTRLPPPHRAPAPAVAAFLRAHFRHAPLTLPASRLAALLDLVSRRAIAGGAIYDALIAATAKYAGATLLTRDRRAVPTYQAVGVSHEMLN